MSYEIIITNPDDNEDENEKYKTDNEKIRGELYGLLERSNLTLDNMQALAQEMDSPRAYNTLVEMFRSHSEIVGKLIDFNNNKKNIDLKYKNLGLKSNMNNTENNITQQNFYVGSTAELQKLLKDSQKNIEDDKN